MIKHDTFPLASVFITPWFAVAGALLTAIPIIIHLLNRRRFKTVVWAAMEYLLAAMKKNRRKLKFEQWTLLIIRCLIPILLGLALARPLGCTDNKVTAMVGQRSGLHVFVVDNAYTMGYEADRPGAKTHLDQAKRIIKDRIDRLIKSGESIALVTAAKPVTVVIAKPSYSLDVAQAAIDRIPLSFAGPDLSTAIQKAVEIASEENTQPNKSLYLLTDGTRAAFESGQVESLPQAAQDAQRVFGANHVYSINLGKPDQWNQAVLDLRPVDNLVTTQFTATFAADVQGFGTATGDPILQWKIDDVEAPGGGRPIKLAPDAPPQLLANRLLTTGGPHVVSVTLHNPQGADHLAADDTRYRVVDVASQLKVLVVDGERDTGSSFLEMALAPGKRADGGNAGLNAGTTKSDSVFAPDVISDLELPTKVLTEYSAVMLTNVALIDEPQADQLRKYVEQGGSLMLFMGPRVNIDNYNAVLGNEKRQLLPGKLIRQISASSVGKESFLFDFKPEGTLSTYLKEFKGLPNSGLGSIRVFTYLQAELPATFSGERVLDYLAAAPAATTATPAAGGAVSAQPAKGDPAITVHGVGRGRVMFFSTTVNDQWTGIAGRPAYLPLIHELITGSIGSTDSWMNLTVGQSVQVPPTLGLTTAPSLLDSAKKEIVVNAVTDKDGQISYRSAEITRPGVYYLNTGSKTYPIAVNVPGDAADIRTIPTAAIKKALGDIALSEHDDQLMPEGAGLDDGRDLGWSCMLMLLVLLGVECFLAMKFGHYRRPVVPMPALAKL